MNNNAYNEISECLSGSFNLDKALKIHNKYSKNYSKKLQLAKSVNKKSLLLTYLQELLHVYHDKNKPLLKKQEENIELKKVYKKSIQSKISEEFHKLIFNDLPDSMKLLVLLRYEKWEDSKKFYNLQQSAEDSITRFNNAKSAILATKENWEIWAEIDNYNKYGKPLGKHHSFKKNEFIEHIKEIEQLSVSECTKKLIKLKRAKESAINRFNSMSNKKALTTEQLKLKQTNIDHYNIVALKLNEPLWKK